MSNTSEFRFVAEHSLGKLARWLRILGFDAVYAPDDAAGQSEFLRTRDRLLLTRTRSLYDGLDPAKAIFITSNNPLAQVREVVRRLELRPMHCAPFSRCINCNILTIETDKSSVIGLVPDYIWHIHDRFNRCPGCAKIFWPGSHRRNVLSIVEKLF